MRSSILNGLELAKTGSDRHKAACEFTQKHYQRRFGCTLKHFMPSSFSYCQGSRLMAVAGFRSAGEETLFLEQYLDLPVEEALTEKLESPGKRESIVEIGGLAAESRGAAFNLMTALAPALLEMGFITAVCTVNKPVRNCLDRLGIEHVCLGIADPSRLQEGDDGWGTYYESEPAVLAGDIRAGVRAITSLAGAGNF